MTTDDTLVFNNKQQAVTQNFAQPATATQQNPSPSLTSTDMLGNIPASPVPATPSADPAPNLQFQSMAASSQAPVITSTQPADNLPDISTFSPAGTTQPVTPLETESTEPDTAPLSEPTAGAATFQSPDSVPPMPHTLSTEPINDSQHTNVQTEAVSSPVSPDFRSMAEEAVISAGSDQRPVTTGTAPVLTSPIAPQPAAVMKVQPAPEPATEQPEPKLESDPFIQEVYEQDVKVEQQALETLIASNRIDPELKEHLKIELLKFKDIGPDALPIGQDINSLAAEVMAPDASADAPTPVTHPIQTLPPEQPM